MLHSASLQISAVSSLGPIAVVRSHSPAVMGPLAGAACAFVLGTQPRTGEESPVFPQQNPAKEVTLGIEQKTKKGANWLALQR